MSQQCRVCSFTQNKLAKKRRQSAVLNATTRESFTKYSPILQTTSENRKQISHCVKCRLWSFTQKKLSKNSPRLCMLHFVIHLPKYFSPKTIVKLCFTLAFETNLNAFCLQGLRWILQQLRNRKLVNYQSVIKRLPGECSREFDVPGVNQVKVFMWISLPWL